MSPSYRKLQKLKLLERSRKGVEARRRKQETAHAGNPVRVDRVVEITIRDSHRPLTVIRLRRADIGGRWGRWRDIGKRAMGKHGVGKLIGEYLE